VFFVGEDREVYRAMLREEARQFGLAVDAFRLMTNHIHLIATPRQEQSLTRAVGRSRWRYSPYINAQRRRSR
jgi:putative transposase